MPALKRFGTARVDPHLGQPLGEGEDDRDRQERHCIGDQCHRDAESRSAGRPARPLHGGEGKADVHQRVALLEQAGRLQDARHRSAREAAARDRQRAIQQAERQHEWQKEVAAGDQRQCGERGRTGQVQTGKASPERCLVEPRGQRGSDERRQELGREEETRGRRDGLGRS